MAFIPDDGAVQEFVAQGAHPSFCVRVCLGRSRWYPDCGDAGPGEDGVVWAGELSGSVSDYEPKPTTVTESCAEAPGDLGRPRAHWIRGDPGEVDGPCRVFDDEQNMDPSEEHGVDAGEVGSDNRFGL